MEPCNEGEVWEHGRRLVVSRLVSSNLASGVQPIQLYTDHALFLDPQTIPLFLFLQRPRSLQPRLGAPSFALTLTPRTLSRSTARPGPSKFGATTTPIETGLIRTRGLSERRTS